MNIFDPLNVFFLVCFVAYVGIRHVYDARAAESEKVDRRVGRAERVLLFGVFLGSLVLPVVYLFTPLFGFADYTGLLAVRGVGAGLLVAALWLFWRSHADLGRNWSVSLEIRAGHELVTGGVYRWIRHPMYAAIFLFALGQGLVLQNWIAGWSALVSFAALYAHRVPREERMMRDVFGAAWDAYAARTGRVVPRL